MNKGVGVGSKEDVEAWVGKKLAPCPFCGSEDIIADFDLLQEIFCNACGANGPKVEFCMGSMWNARKGKQWKTTTTNSTKE